MTLIVIEGLDGAGKATTAARLAAAIERRGVDVARLAFPRYGRSVHADLARDALYGRLGDVGESVHGMALLFALDRLDAAERIRAATHDVVLIDRYIASNAAYGAARLHQDAGGEFVDWVRATEVDRFDIPVPNHQLLLAVPEHVAAGRAQRRAHDHPDRARDAFEADGGLQARTAAVYEQLAAAGWLSPWTVLGDDTDLDDLAERLLAGASGSDGPRCRYCGADCSDGRSWDGGDRYACPACSNARAAGVPVGPESREGVR